MGLAKRTISTSTKNKQKIVEVSQANFEPEWKRRMTVAFPKIEDARLVCMCVCV